jgi:hypothetical protein
MTFNAKGELTDDALGPLVITWTANEPTAALTQTIADGTTPTVAELGQAVKNLNAIITDLVAQVNA